MTPLRLTGLVAIVFGLGWAASSLVLRKGPDRIGAALNRAGEEAVAAHIAQGVKALDAGDPDEALRWFDKAVKLSPETAEPYLQRGIAYGEKKDYDRALADYNEAVRLEPENSLTFHCRGMCHAERKDYDKAIADFTEAIRLDGKTADSYVERGYAYLDCKDYPKALADFEQAIRLEPERPDGYSGRGYYYERTKAYAKAIADHSKAIRLDPKDSQSYNNLAWIYATCPEKNLLNGSKAVEYALHVCKLTEWKERWYFDTLAAGYARIGKFDEAVKWQKKALEPPDVFEGEEEAQKARHRLSLYEKGQAYTDDD